MLRLLAALAAARAALPAAAAELRGAAGGNLDADVSDGNASELGPPSRAPWGWGTDVFGFDRSDTDSNSTNSSTTTATTTTSSRTTTTTTSTTTSTSTTETATTTTATITTTTWTGTSTTATGTTTTLTTTVTTVTATSTTATATSTTVTGTTTTLTDTSTTITTTTVTTTSTTEWANPNCAINGFWEVDGDIVARFWKSDVDLGSYQLAGRGQCADGGERKYGGWSSPSARFDLCKAICDAAEGCVGVEFFNHGGCVVRYDVEGLAEEPPAGVLTTFHEGDDATGLVGGTREPWDRICYMKPKLAVLQEASVADPYGGFWRLTLYARAGKWLYETVSWKEFPFAVTQQAPAAFKQCGTELPILAAPPYVPDTAIWWGTREIHLWAGRSTQWASWRYGLRTAAWDSAHALGADRCPVDAGMHALPGRRQSVEHALWGLRECSSQGFRRLSPDRAGMDEAGWAEVVAQKFRYGVEVFLLRYVDWLDRVVEDYDCFQEVVQGVWDSLDTVDFGSLLTRVGVSPCTNWP